MKSFLIISFVLYYTLRFNGRVNGFNSDFAKLENLLTQEKAIIESLDEYLGSEEVLISRLRRLTDKSLSLNSIAPKEYAEGSLLGHPLDVYLLIRRMAIDWKEVNELLRTKDQRLSEVQMRQIGGHYNYTNALNVTFDSQVVSSNHENITNKELKGIERSLS